MSKKKKDDEAIVIQLQQRKYDPNKPPPTEQVVFIIESKNIGTLQNFITITGLQKSGKTRYLSAMIAAGLMNTDIFGMRIHLPENKRRIAYFDTEQGDYDFYRTMDGIRMFCQSDKLPANFDSYNLREDEPREIVWMIEKYLQINSDCGLLVIDGILDLIESFNDEAESKRLINTLKKITKVYNLLALLTLHKGKTTANTLGHLGSMADRAAQSVLLVEKVKERNSFLLKADYLRSADDFTPIEIYFEKNEHTWKQTFYNPEQDTKVKRLQIKPDEYDIETHRQTVVKIFSFQEVVSYDQITKDIMELYAVSRQWARSCVKHLLEKQLIFRTEYGYTNRQQAKLYIQ
jgi:hypothetical protein